MNGTIIDIDGISVMNNVVDLDGTTDRAYILTIKDKFGTRVDIEIQYEKITSVWNRKE